MNSDSAVNAVGPEMSEMWPCGRQIRFFCVLWISLMCV